MQVPEIDLLFNLEGLSAISRLKFHNYKSNTPRREDVRGQIFFTSSGTWSTNSFGITSFTNV